MPRVAFQETMARLNGQKNATKSQIWPQNHIRIYVHSCFGDYWYYIYITNITSVNIFQINFFPGPFLEKGVKSSLKLKFRSRFMPMALVAYRAVNVGSLLSGGGQFLRVAALCSH